MINKQRSLPRRTFIRGLASSAGVMLAGCSETDPPTYGNLLRMGDLLTYRAHRLLLPEQADALFRAKGIRIQKWMTGGLDRDDQPGDELLSAVIVPHDDDGETVKLPGTIQLRLLDPAMTEDGQRIGEWTFTSEESRRHWHKGMIASG